MWVCAVLEAFDVVGDGGGVDSLVDCTLAEHVRVMDALGTGKDLLTSHEEVVGTGVVGVVLAEHCVERTSSCWIAMQHVEVSIVLVLH